MFIRRRLRQTITAISLQVDTCKGSHVGSAKYISQAQLGELMKPDPTRLRGRNSPPETQQVRRPVKITLEVNDYLRRQPMLTQKQDRREDAAEEQARCAMERH
jgi:hypothetical protein